MNQIFNHLFLIIGFIFTFFVPGFLVIETFFSKIPKIMKLPLYMLLSIMVSSYLVYFISFFIGFTRFSILVSFSIFIVWLMVYFIRRKRKIILWPRNHIVALGFAFFSALLFLIALYPAIFTYFSGYYVMSSVNWQDTPMHLGIIESLSQGNFPPQAPYYAGAPLNYYYFSDFHSAILNTLYGQFFPRVLVYINPFFSFIFFLSLYGLGYLVTKRKNLSIFSAFLGLFFSNLMFIRFFQDLSGELSSPDANLINSIVNILMHRSYSLEINQLFQIPTMADYFLQNRPMMIGLPATALIVGLIYWGFMKNKDKAFLLAGIVALLLVKFQFFAYIISYLVIVVGAISFFDRKKIKVMVKRIVLFLIPASVGLIISLFVLVNESSLVDQVKDNFSLGGWDKGKDIIWRISFLIANFGIPIIIFAVALFLKFFKIITNKKFNQGRIYLLFLALVLITIPYMIVFTIYVGDMFKFFFFLIIPLSVITFDNLLRLVKGSLFEIIVGVILFTSVATSFLTLGNSFLNKNMAYSQEDFEVGLWIRENTPQRSVFIGEPTVHSPITQIGGRLRVLSYINWPYSHGFNLGDDNVFRRLGDVEAFYSTDYDLQKKKEIIGLYKIAYVYYGKTEREKYPELEVVLDASEAFNLVYNTNGVKIYKVL